MEDLFKVIGGIILVIAVIVGVIATPLLVFGDRRVEHIKTVARSVLADNGFELVGYQGYALGLIQTPGGCVWYTMRRGDITYEGCISQWGSEYHIYSLRALDAIKP